MAHIVKDRVLETSTTTGTGALTLAGAVDRYRTFAAVCAVGDTVPYAIEGAATTGEFETGIGTYSGADTLTRTLVIASSNAGAAVNFSAGTKNVMLSNLAQNNSFRGALVKKAADQTTADYSTLTTVAWDAESYDTDAIHDNVTNNSRLTVPSGVTCIRLHCSMSLSSTTTSDWISLRINKNGNPDVGLPFLRSEQGATTGGIEVVSAVIEVAAGDYFEVQMQVESDTSLTVNSNRSSFAMEIIQPGGKETILMTGDETLDVDFTDAGNSGTSETDLFTKTLDAGELAFDGDRIVAQWSGTFVNSGTATRQVRAYFGGTLIFDTGALTIGVSGAAWDAFCTITRVSASVIRYAVSLTTQGAALAAYTSAGEVTGLTLANTQIIKLTGTAAGVGAASNDIVGKMASVEKHPVQASGSVVAPASATDVLTGTDAVKSVTPDALAALWEQGADVASAGTISLGEGGYFNITGTTTITDVDFATDKTGRRAWVKFTGSLTLTHNASTLILPGAANITTAAGDTACFISEGSDAVRCVAFQRASGAVLAAWDFVPPTVASFSTASADATQVIMTDDADVGLLMDPGAVGSAVCRWAYRTLTDKTLAWDMKVKIKGWLTTQNFSNIGLQIQDSTSAKNYKLILDNSIVLGVSHYSSLTTFVATDASMANPGSVKVEWLRIAFDGTNLVFYVSADGKLWSQIFTIGYSSYLGTQPDRVGIQFSYARTSGPKNVASCPYFSLTGAGV